ncbi:MAG: LuxR C-terminal-related transcriptional regulator [Syntrophomonas sp.]
MSKPRQYNPKYLYFSDRITAAMDGIFDHPLTIVEAPMGYGKTTAVREYLNNAGVSILWQRVYDSSTSNFWYGFSRLFSGLDDDRTQSLLCLGFPNDIISAREALKLIEDIELPVKTVLVIDDYHLIDSPAVNSFIDLLVENEIDNLHIVLAARYTTFQKLAELELKGYLHHVGKETLKLMPQEITGYYQACGINLKSNEADRLYAVTEGWISALYLFMLEYIAEGSYTPAKSIYTLIEKAVFRPLSDEIKELVITMCIFESFTHEQAVHMWRKENTGRLLDEVTSKNAFVKYDDRLKTYHMHKIFTGFLLEELERKNARYKQDLYQKAGYWYLKNGDYIAARHYFYRSGDFDSVMLALEEDRTNSFTNENKEILKRHMADCPGEVKSRHPYALLKYLMHLFVHNEGELFSKVCREFHDNVATNASLGDDTRNRLLGELEFMLSFPAYNDLKKMTAHHQKAWQLMKQSTSIMNNKANWTFGCPSVLYMIYRESGKLEEQVEELKNAMSIYYLLNDGQGMGAEYVMEAERCFNLGDFDNAEISVHKALYKAQSKMQDSIILCAVYLQIRLAFMRGDFTQMFELLHKMREDMTTKKQYHFLHTVEICEGSIYSNLNQKHEIPARLVDVDITNLHLRFPAWGAFNIMYGRVLLINGEYFKLIGLSDYFITIASVFPNLLGHVYTYIYAAAANRKVFRDDEALANLRQALEIAMPDKMYMPFVENCDYIEPLLEKLAGEGRCQEDIARILELYKTYRKHQEQIIRKHFTADKPRLTEREMEIARLAAEGITNAEIGKRLYISTNTVKMALKSIYAKLSINSRSLLKQHLYDLDS